MGQRIVSIVHKSWPVEPPITAKRDGRPLLRSWHRTCSHSLRTVRSPRRKQVRHLKISSFISSNCPRTHSIGGPTQSGRKRSECGFTEYIDHQCCRLESQDPRMLYWRWRAWRWRRPRPAHRCFIARWCALSTRDVRCLADPSSLEQGPKSQFQCARI